MMRIVQYSLKQLIVSVLQQLFNAIPERDGRTDGQNCYTSIALAALHSCAMPRGWKKPTFLEKAFRF